MTKKILSAVLALCLAASMGLTALAKSSFSDVISPDYDWAADEIEEMTTLGIIKGYTDGTFRPAITIRKIEALLLLSRAAGYSNADYEPFVHYAISLYTPVLEKYDLGATYNLYKDEVAFLLYKGVLSDDELDSWLGSAGSALKRYEAAVLLTKLMGAEEAVKNNSSVLLSYSDTPKIPSDALPYVEYVTAQGLMKGLENNEFGPNENVTRVQITILLHRILDALDQTTKTGTVTAVDLTAEDGPAVTVYNETAKTTETYSIGSGVSVIKDGVKSAAANIVNGSEALAVFSGDKLVGFEALSPDTSGSDANTNTNTNTNTGTNTNTNTNSNANTAPEDEEVSGRLADLSFRTGSVSFAVVEGRDYREIVVADNSDAKVTVDGKKAELNDLKNGYNVTVYIEKGVVDEIEAKTGEQTVSGTVRSKKDDTVTLRTDSNANAEYDVDEDVTVTRNSAKADFEDVAVGDKATLKLLDGVVTEITATSANSSINGSITAITISSAPTIEVEVDGEKQSYEVSSKAKITVSGKTAEIYDLRVGNNVTLDLESGVITAVVASVSPSAYQKSGVVTSISTTNSYLTVSIDGKSERVYAAKRSNGAVTAAVLNNATGKTVNFSDIKRGDTVTAIGSLDADGRFTATTIVVMPAE